jgi:hypothetical protein
MRLGSGGRKERMGEKKAGKAKGRKKKEEEDEWLSW